MRQPFVLFKGLTFQKLCLPGAFRPGDHHNRGLTLSGTKTHVKQRFLPLTPLLMVSDDLWSPVLPA
ncbi:hypothetical protein CVE19_12080 [Escherichia coli]|nr:hypothetical protein CVE17_11840 [Escherichia coli]PJG03682.1 hypothetical protein CVE19_12080 [Escherichia coli]